MARLPTANSRRVAGGGRPEPARLDNQPLAFPAVGAPVTTTHLLAVVALLSPAQAGKKPKKDVPVPSAEAPANPVAWGTFPDDAATRGFVQKLASSQIRDFAANDGEGAKLIFTSLRFQADNTWSAEGYIEAGGEQVSCAETGTWTSEPATSPVEATITWTIGTTDCISRSKGDKTRALVKITKDDVEISLR